MEPALIYPMHDLNLSKVTKTYAEQYTHWHFFFRCGCFFRANEDGSRTTQSCLTHRVLRTAKTYDD
jgi:hypothetical protein